MATSGKGTGPGWPQGAGRCRHEAPPDRGARGNEHRQRPSPAIADTRPRKPSTGSVGNSVCVRSVERHGQAMARVKRFGQRGHRCRAGRDRHLAGPPAGTGLPAGLVRVGAKTRHPPALSVLRPRRPAEGCVAPGGLLLANQITCTFALRAVAVHSDSLDPADTHHARSNVRRVRSERLQLFRCLSSPAQKPSAKRRAAGVDPAAPPG